MLASVINWAALLVVVIMLLGAAAVLVVRQHMAAVAATTVVSLGASAAFAMLRAPDVAMTEAAVGAGLSSVIMALALRRLGLWRITTGSGSEANRREVADKQAVDGADA